LTISIDNVYFVPVQVSAVRSTPERGRCPICRVPLVLRTAEEVIIRNAIVRVDAPTGRVTAKCPRCKGWVEVPLRYVG
jgi:uncharacterized protein with PIN domain